MAVTYSQAEGVWVGLSNTFDGQHPCSLCTSVRRAAVPERTDESSSTRLPPTETIWVAVLPLESAWVATDGGQPVATRPEYYLSDRGAPPTPPPRV
jgi:hypothetical protein